MTDSPLKMNDLENDLDVSRFSFLRERAYTAYMASEKSLARSPQRVKRGPSQLAHELKTGRPMVVESLESVVLTALKTVPRRQAKANSQDQVQERTVRMRRQGEPDRRFLVAYAIDPNDSEAVIFRIRPATSRDLGPARTPLLSTQQAADQLNVSRPYVVKLVEDGVFQGVERTQAGHRRIPAAEVARVQQAMQVSRRTALKRVDTLTSDLRQQELDEARTASKRRWVKTA